MRIKCCDCGQEINHECRSDMKEAIMSLMTWCPEDGLGDKEFYKQFIEHGKKMGWNTENDPSDTEAPFFGSQAWSYILFGTKNDARSFHALLHGVIRAAGFEPYDILKEVYAYRREKDEERLRREAYYAKQRERRAAEEAGESEDS